MRVASRGPAVTIARTSPIAGRARDAAAAGDEPHLVLSQLDRVIVIRRSADFERHGSTGVPGLPAGEPGVLVGDAGKAPLPPPQPLIHTVIPTKSALTDAALNSRRVTGCPILLTAKAALLILDA